MWQVYVDGAPRDPLPPRSLDSLRAVAHRVVRAVQREGYYLARLDSIAVDTAGAVPGGVRLYVRRGPEVRIGRLRLEGVEVFRPEAVKADLRTRVGERLRPAVLERDLEALVARYEQAGYPLAQARVAVVRLLPGDPPTLGVMLAVEEGAPVTVQAVEVTGEARTRPHYAARVAGLRLGQPLAAFDAEAVRQRLLATGLFRTVDRPEVRAYGDSAVVRLALEEAPPGRFNLALGYQPPSGEAGARLVGSGHLVLRNLLGRGRELALDLSRRPGPASEARVRLSDPYLFGWPLRVTGTFEGIQQDSTYDTQRYRLGLGYRLRPGLELTLSLERRRTQPGQAGTRLRGGRQRVPRSGAWFAGLGLRYRSLDRPPNPRRGLWLEVTLARGRKTQSARLVTEGDTLRRRTTLRQERLRTRLRLFVPTWTRQVLALGADGALLLSDRYAVSELFRFGGAQSPRGYDEDAFRGNAVAPLLAEYRFRFERRSYAYLFADLGYVRTPALNAEDTTAQDVYPGYGLGLQVDTDLGLVNAGYAMNPESGPLNGRIHLGLSVGL